jgi:hypothetical protein
VEKRSYSPLTPEVSHVAPHSSTHMFALAPRITVQPRVVQTRRTKVRVRAVDEGYCALVCTSKECKRIGRSPRTLALLQELVENDPEFAGLSVGTTRCQSECADGPNVKLLPEGAVLNDCRSEEDCKVALRRLAAYERST